MSQLVRRQGRYAQVEVPVSFPGQEPNRFGSGCLQERPQERPREGQAKAEEGTADSSCQFNVATKDAARETQKGKGKRYPTPTSEPSEGEGDPLALKSLELASIETPMAHQVTLDSGAATSCIPDELAAALGYKPVLPEGANSKIYKTASGETVTDLGKINAKVTSRSGEREEQHEPAEDEAERTRDIQGIEMALESLILEDGERVLSSIDPEKPVCEDQIPLPEEMAEEARDW